MSLRDSHSEHRVAGELEAVFRSECQSRSDMTYGLRGDSPELGESGDFPSPIDLPFLGAVQPRLQIVGGLFTIRSGGRGGLACGVCDL